MLYYFLSVNQSCVETLSIIITALITMVLQCFSSFNGFKIGATMTVYTPCIS